MTVKEFIEGRPAATSRSYRSSVKKFLLSVYGQGELEDLAAKYIADYVSRDFVADLKVACVACNTGKTASHLRASVLEFLRFHDIFPDEKTMYRLRKVRRSSEAETMDRALTLEDTKRIINHLGIREKAIVLVMLSSGARIGEVLSMSVKDLDLDKVPVRINLRFTKNGKPRYSFISQEAAAMVREYLLVRNRLNETASKRRGDRKVRDDGRLFPISYVTFRESWNLALEKAGFVNSDGTGRDVVTKRRLLHPHSCRKTFLTRMKVAGVPDIIAEGLSGHDGYLAAAYRRLTEEDIIKGYLKGESAVTIAGNHRQISEQLADKDKEIAELRVRMEKMDGHIHDLQARIIAYILDPTRVPFS
jgi:integrase